MSDKVLISTRNKIIQILIDANLTVEEAAGVLSETRYHLRCLTEREPLAGFFKSLGKKPKARASRVDAEISI